MKVIHVLRKPMSEGTVAANVLKHGTSALNIDATRIGTSDNLNGGAYAENPTERWDGTENWRYKRGAEKAGEYKQPKGRWPSNVVLQHLPTCEQAGTRKVKASGFDRSKPPRSSGLIFGNHRDTPASCLPDPDGTETVAAWACAPGCPVAELDVQTGNLKSGVMTGLQRGWGIHGIYGSSGETLATCYADSGGASRFYKQVGGNKSNE